LFLGRVVDVLAHMVGVYQPNENVCLV